MRKLLAILLSVAGAVTLAGCEPKPLYVDQAYVRLSPNPDSPSAGYFTVHGGEQDVVLREVMSEAAVLVEMHDSVMKGGMMTMKPVDSVDVPAGGMVRFEPGGKHLMLWKINQGVADSGKIPLVFLFSNGDRILVDAAVQQPGAAPPANQAE